jgi:hypothetical protein
VSAPAPAHIPDEQYFAAPGLSNSSMKDLAVSPLRYWHLHINPNRPPKRESPEMTFGKALHCAVLEPDQFEQRYCCDIDATDFDGYLITMDDLRAWLKSHGLPSSGKTKDELVERVATADPSAPVFALLQQRWEAENAGKVQLSKYDWARVESAASALLSEPALQDIRGQAEVAMWATDPETGVPLKAKMDCVSDAYTLDLKTFSQQRGKSIDKSVTDAIFYEKYYRQAYFYSYVRSLQPGAEKPGLAACAPPFVLAFVESEEPHEVRLRVLRAKTFGEVNIYWERARIEVHGLIQTYADCQARFGERPWREPRELDPLEDQEMPQLAY